jgi:hypothetical protein
MAYKAAGCAGGAGGGGLSGGVLHGRRVLGGGDDPLPPVHGAEADAGQEEDADDPRDGAAVHLLLDHDALARAWGDGHAVDDVGHLHWRGGVHRVGDGRLLWHALGRVPRVRCGCWLGLRRVLALVGRWLRWCVTLSLCGRSVLAHRSWGGVWLVGVGAAASACTRAGSVRCLKSWRVV